MRRLDRVRRAVKVGLTVVSVITGLPAARSSRALTVIATEAATWTRRGVGETGIHAVPDGKW